MGIKEKIKARRSEGKQEERGEKRGREHDGEG
jgi:hypothetical protein